jgi:hypothetical protein
MQKRAEFCSARFVLRRETGCRSLNPGRWTDSRKYLSFTNAYINFAHGWRGAWSPIAARSGAQLQARGGDFDPCAGHESRQPAVFRPSRRTAIRLDFAAFDGAPQHESPPQ